MSRLKLSLAFFLCVIVSACAEFRPFEDRRREPGTEQVYVGRSAPLKPAICYNPIFYNIDDIKSIADEICTKEDINTHAEFVDKDNFSCRLFVPARAYFKCVTNK